MKTALLCNGPSRLEYNPEIEYDYVIGCNIPWTKVNSTVIVDVNVLDKLQPLIPFYCSRMAWINCNKQNRYSDYLIELFDTLKDYDSAGHCAARILLKMNVSQIDIYGCDSWFKNDTESFTHKYIDSRSSDMNKHISVWRARWYEMMGNHPDVNFNFIGDTK